jgi:hypothetical protein
MTKSSRFIVGWKRFFPWGTKVNEPNIPSHSLQYWRDEFLRWDPARFGGISQLHIPVELIWRPDLLVYNKFFYKTKHSLLHLCH